MTHDHDPLSVHWNDLSLDTDYQWLNCR